MPFLKIQIMRLFPSIFQNGLQIESQIAYAIKTHSQRPFAFAFTIPHHVFPPNGVSAFYFQSRCMQYQLQQQNCLRDLYYHKFQHATYHLKYCFNSLVMIRIIKIQKTLFPSIRSLFSEASKKQEGNESPTNDALVETKDSVQLMEDNYEKVQMGGLRDRDITGVNQFQKDILSQNKFNLLDAKIEPKIASISTTMGLDLDQNNYLAEINLGKIKVKKENQVFLSEIDPYNIPEYYDIVFDYEKQMTLVGTKTATVDSATPPQAQMNISTRKAFEQKSQGELSRDILGVEYNPLLNSKIVWKQLLQAIALAYFVSSAMVETFGQLDICRKSIRQIEEERMKQLQKMKRESLVDAMMTNPDMKII